jgi:biotin carboxylase
VNWICLIGAIPGAATAVAASGRRLMVIGEADCDVPGAGGIAVEVTRQAEVVALADLTDPAAVVAACDRLIELYGVPELVVSFTEYGSLPAAQISKKLGLPSVSASAVTLSRDKRLMRARLVGTPWEWPFRTGSHAAIAAAIEPELAEGPWVVKPADGYGSIDVTVLTDGADLRRWARQPGRDTQAWIAEKLAGGPEFSVEAVSSGGHHRITGIAAEQTAGDSDLIADGHWHLFPALISGEQAEQIGRATSGVLDALEIREGPSHTEVRLDPVHGPVVIETHTRLGGCHLPELIRLVNGIDLYREALSALLGEPLPTTPSAAAASCIRFLLAPADGLLTGIEFPVWALSDPCLHELNWTASIGDRVTVPQDSDTYLGYIITLADHPRAAMDAAAKLRLAVTVQITTMDGSLSAHTAPR